MKELEDAEVAESVPWTPVQSCITLVEWSSHSLCVNAVGDSHVITVCSYKNFRLTYTSNRGLEGDEQ